MSVGMMSFGLTAEGGFCTAWLQVVEKITRQVDLFSEEGSAGIKNSCFRMNMHSQSRSLSSGCSFLFYSLPAGGKTRDFSSERIILTFKLKMVSSFSLRKSYSLLCKRSNSFLEILSLDFMIVLITNHQDQKQRHRQSFLPLLSA